MTDDVKSRVQALIDQGGAERVAVAFHDLATGQEVLIWPDEPFHPASTFKTCVMMEVFRQAHEGLFSLDERIPIKNRFASIADGDPFSTAIEDDSETTLYSRIGERETIRELSRLMIVRSSNLATSLLVEWVTPTAVTQLMRALGAPDLIVLRGPEDNRAYARGMNNVATARGLMHILQCLAERKVVSSRASDEMIETLLGQEHNDMIPAGLPDGVRAANKPGWNDRLYHDAGIVFPPGREPYVLAVMTRGIEQEAEAKRLVTDISWLIYERSVSVFAGS